MQTDKSLPEPLLNRKEAARLLGIQEQTLACWSSTERYPLPFVRVGRAIRYRQADLLAFVESRTVRPCATSTPSAGR